MYSKKFYGIDILGEEAGRRQSLIKKRMEIKKSIYPKEENTFSSRPQCLLNQ